MVQIEIATLGPKFEALVNELAQSGGDVCITRDGKIVGKLVIFKNAVSDKAAVEADVSTTGDRRSTIGRVIDEGNIVSPTDAE